MICKQTLGAALRAFQPAERKKMRTTHLVALGLPIAFLVVWYGVQIATLILGDLGLLR